ncbi:hypothetical protein [Allorhodopirellula solitaria]|uniref:Uncharacterized protein n=1 Tax=Allorhodopirellula solitaria TaxID=2527987 RepID=A0A5C5X0T3_9BACT|nr:hypothetical protein [Allorhodopirellula solitaria]TWT56468.1 hypothetical protein CA85_39980 [Allorhodopirellula solitaria]
MTSTTHLASIVTLTLLSSVLCRGNTAMGQTDLKASSAGDTEPLRPTYIDDVDWQGGSVKVYQGQPGKLLVSPAVVMNLEDIEVRPSLDSLEAYVDATVDCCPYELRRKVAERLSTSRDAFEATDVNPLELDFMMLQPQRGFEDVQPWVSAIDSATGTISPDYEGTAVEWKCPDVRTAELLAAKMKDGLPFSFKWQFTGTADKEQHALEVKGFVKLVEDWSNEFGPPSQVKNDNEYFTVRAKSRLFSDVEKRVSAVYRSSANAPYPLQDSKIKDLRGLLNDHFELATKSGEEIRASEFENAYVDGEQFKPDHYTELYERQIEKVKESAETLSDHLIDKYSDQESLKHFSSLKDEWSKMQRKGETKGSGSYGIGWGSGEAKARVNEEVRKILGNEKLEVENKKSKLTEHLKDTARSAESSEVEWIRKGAGDIWELKEYRLFRKRDWDLLSEDLVYTADVVRYVQSAARKQVRWSRREGASDVFSELRAEIAALRSDLEKHRMSTASRSDDVAKALEDQRDGLQQLKINASNLSKTVQSEKRFRESHFSRSGGVDILNIDRIDGVEEINTAGRNWKWTIKRHVTDENARLRIISPGQKFELWPSPKGKILFRDRTNNDTVTGRIDFSKKGIISHE